MAVSIPTFLSTFVFGFVMIFLLAFFLHNKASYSYIGLRFLTVFSWMILLRLLLPVEFPVFTITLPSKTIMPWIRDTLNLPLYTVMGTSVTLLKLLLVLWALGVFVYNLKLWRSYHRLSLLASLCDSPPKKAAEILKDLKCRRHVTKEIPIIESPCFSTPALAGIRKPVIFLPQNHYSDKELTYILRHEFTHFQHHDNLFKLVIEIINSFYWWNPVFYLLKKQLDTILEFRVDSEVIQASPDASEEYMKCLLDMYKRQQKVSSLTCAFCNTKEKGLLQRFQYMTSQNTVLKNSVIFVMATCLSIFFASFSFIFEARYPTIHEMPNIYDPEEFSKGHIIKNCAGEYILYLDNMPMCTIDIELDDFKDLPVYETK